MTINTIHIRRAHPTEAVSILKLMQKMHSRYMPNDPPVNDRDALAWIAQTVCYGICFNAIIGGRIIGTVGLKGEYIAWNRKYHQANVEWLHVTDNFIHSDVRDKLISAARTLCIELGFDFILSIPDYLSTEQDAALLPENLILRTIQHDKSQGQKGKAH